MEIITFNHPLSEIVQYTHWLGRHWWEKILGLI